MQWLDESKRPLDWNGPTGRVFTRFPDEDLDRPIIDHFERVARRHRNRIAVSDSNTSLSYTELLDGVSGLAETITARTQPGDLVGIALTACSMFPLAILACLAAGRPFVALDPHYPSDWFDQVLEDAKPALIIGRDRLTSPSRGGDASEASEGVAHGGFLCKAGVDEPACVVFTSGSTGRPKGIVNSQRNLLQRVAQSINSAHINADDRFLTLASLCTIVGVRDILTALLAGAHVRLLDPQRAGGREILNVIRRENITILFAFPALLRSVVACATERAGDDLRLVRIGGDTTLWTDIDRLRGWLAPESAIQLIYAATEAPMMQWFVDDASRTDDPRIPIGYPLPGNRLALVDGELIVSSPYVALGLESNGASRIFRTGDLVRQRPDGLLERIGRKDRQVKIRGSRVDLEGVEALLRRHPLVRDVGVLARMAGGEASIVAYVSGDSAVGDLKEFMRSAPAPMRPVRFYLVQEIPRLPSSKLDVRALRALDEANIENERVKLGAASEGDSIARTVAQIWQDVLQVPSVPKGDDDFFEAGGDSLKAITFMNALERALDVNLPLTLINESPVFARLCAALRERRPEQYVPLVPLKSGAGLPPVFFVHGVGGNVASLFPTARRMSYPGPVIGIKARGLSGEEPPHATVEAMAVEYLKEIKALQPHGPYYLCGYSFGGLVAFEMARRLWQSGEEIGLVGLFDTRMSPIRWPLQCWLSILRRRIVQFGPAAIWNMARHLRQRLGGYALTSVIKVLAGGLIASARYRPGFYPGELTLFTPVGREPSLPSLQAIWSKHAGSLSIVETAGAHSTMLSAPNAESAAASLTKLLPVC